MYHNCHFSENICLNLSHINLNHALYGLIPVINEGFLSQNLYDSTALLKCLTQKTGDRHVGKKQNTGEEQEAGTPVKFTCSFMVTSCSALALATALCSPKSVRDKGEDSFSRQLAEPPRTEQGPMSVSNTGPHVTA